VERLELLGLYAYLQPGASALMKKQEGFRSRYIRGLEDAAAAGTGELAALVRDYLEDYINWDAGAAENYKSAFLAGRRFVLPMNPPRTGRPGRNGRRGRRSPRRSFPRGDQKTPPAPAPEEKGRPRRAAAGRGAAPCFERINRFRLSPTA
jgi:hypothetical protein